MTGKIKGGGLGRKMWIHNGITISNELLSNNTFKTSAIPQKEYNLPRKATWLYIQLKHLVSTLFGLDVLAIPVTPLFLKLLMTFMKIKPFIIIKKLRFNKYIWVIFTQFAIQRVLAKGEQLFAVIKKK